MSKLFFLLLLMLGGCSSLDRPHDPDHYRKWFSCTEAANGLDRERQFEASWRCPD